MKKHVFGALKRKKGAVAYKETGDSFDHLAEIRNALRGAKEGLESLKKHLGDPNSLSDVCAAFERLLFQLSQQVDGVRKILRE